MNSEDHDQLIEKFGIACANIDRVLKELNTYQQQIVDNVSDMEEIQETCGSAIMRAVSNTAEARHDAVDMKLHLSKKFRIPLSLLRSKIITMQTAFDEANEETGRDRLPFIEIAIRDATFAKRNCDNIYTSLDTMFGMPNNKGNNKGNNKVNKGGSRKHKKRIQRVRTHRKKTRRVHSRK